MIETTMAVSMPHVEQDWQKIHRPDPYIRRVIITVTIIAVAYIAWLVREVVIILFGGLLMATLLTALANLLMRLVPLHRKAAVISVVFLMSILLVGIFWWFGGSVADQFEDIREKIPGAIESVEQWLDDSPIASALGSNGGDSNGMELPWTNVALFTGTALGAIANTILILAIGIYLAVTPGLYWQGLLRMVPPAYRDSSAEAFSEASEGLRLWLVGQLIAMVVIGVLTAIGLKLLDVPLALSLGILAGLLEFVPFIGPVVFGLLAVLLAFTDSPMTALYVALLTIAIQQFESNVLTPIVQRRTVKLPPALGLIAVVIFGVLFGIPGILFATPLMVVAMILVKKLYVEDALEAGEIEPDEPRK